MAVRRGVLDVCHAQGWLDEQAARMAGVAREGLSVTEGDERHKPFYLDAQTLRCFHALSQSPELLDVFRLLFGEEPLAHSRNILRTIFPNSSQITTPAHQDYVQIGGTTETWTTWISLGECPVKLGGLAVSSGLHTKGVLEMKSAYGAGGVGVDVPEDTPWYTTHYQAGDVIAFYSLNVHQGQDNFTEILRLSVDFRYQPVSHEIHEYSLLPHTREKNWDRIYSHWPDADDSLKHYWKRQAAHVT